MRRSSCGVAVLWLAATVHIIAADAPASHEQDRFAMAQQLLQEAYGFDAPATAGDVAQGQRFATAGTMGGGGEQEEVIAAQEVQRDADVQPKPSSSPSPQSGAAKAKKLGTAALKLGATAVQKSQEAAAIKAARKPKADQCVMCVYTLERLQLLLTPAHQYPQTDIVGGELGKPGRFLKDSRGTGRIPVQFPRASAYKGKAPLDPATAPWRNRGAPPLFATSGDQDLLAQLAPDSDPAAQSAPSFTEPPAGFQWPDADAGGGDQAPPGSAPAAAGGGSGGGLARFRAMQRDDSATNGDGGVPSQPLTPPPLPPFASLAQLYGGSEAQAAGGASATDFHLYPYDTHHHPPPPPLGPPPAVAWPEWSRSAAGGDGDVGGPAAAQMASAMLTGDPPLPTSLLETSVGDAVTDGASLGAGAHAGAQPLPDHMYSHWFHSPPTARELAAAQHNPDAAQQVAAAMSAGVQHLYVSYLQLADEEMAAAAQLHAAASARADEELADVHAAAWLAAHGGRGSRFSASTFHGGGVGDGGEDLAFLELGEGSDQLLDAEDGEEPAPATAAAVDAGTPGSPAGGGDFASIRTGTPLDGAALDALDGSAGPPTAGAASAGAPGFQASLSGGVYRDFAGEAAVFGDFPRMLSPEDQAPYEAGQPPRMAPPPIDKGLPVAAAAAPAKSPAKGGKAAGLKGLPGKAGGGKGVVGEEVTSGTEPDGTIAVGVWRGGGDVPSYGSRRRAVTQDVWQGDTYVAAGYAPRIDGDSTSRFLPPSTGRLRPDVAVMANRTGEAMRGWIGNKAAERIFGREGLRGQPGYNDAAVPYLTAPASAPTLNTTSPEAVAHAEQAMAAAAAAAAAAPTAPAADGAAATSTAPAKAAPDAKGAPKPATLLEVGEGEGGPFGKLTGALNKLAGAAMFPLPHACRKGESLCAQRMRQPSLYDLYRRRRRDEQRSATNRALLSYSLALDIACGRDSEGLNADAARTQPVAEEVMAGYPTLASETHTSGGGYLSDQWSYLRVQTRQGDNVGVGSLRSYALPE